MLNDEVKAIWNANAEFWDSKMGEGNAFHKTLIEPTIVKHFFANGFVLEALEEPSFSKIENSSRIYDNVYQHIPPALVCRLKI